jgi:hypothetical protein
MPLLGPKSLSVRALIACSTLRNDEYETLQQMYPDSEASR